MRIYGKKRKNSVRKAISMMLAVMLLITGLPINIALASNGETPGSSSVVYVNGTMGASGDGTTAGTAVKTLSEAYAKFANTLRDGETAYIIICGNLSLYNGNGLIDSGLTKLDGAVGNVFALPEHDGTVVITSKLGQEDFKQTASVAFYGGDSDTGRSVIMHLSGDTVFENLNVSCRLYWLCADYNALTLGEGLTSTDTRPGMGGRWAMYVNGGYFGSIAPGTTAADSNIVIKSGTFRDVMGGDRIPNGLVSGLENYSTRIQIDGGNIVDLYGSGFGNPSNNIAHKNVFVTVNGGRIDNLYGADMDSTVSGDVNIQVAAGANIVKLHVVESGAKVHGKKSLVLKGYGSSDAYATPVLGSILNADSLVLDGSYVELDTADETFWNSLTHISLQEGSLLKLDFIPSNPSPVAVGVSNSSGGHTTGSALIIAPFGTGNIFNLVSPAQGYELVYQAGDSGTGASWALGEVENTDPQEDILKVYVNGTVAASGDGTTADTAVKTLSEAYAKFADTLQDGETAYIIICGNLNLYDGNGLTDSGLIKLDGNVGNAFALPEHDGTVVITSKLGQEDFMQTASVAFYGGDSDTGRQAFMHLSGDTVFENLKVSCRLYWLCADYNALTLGEGLVSTDTRTGMGGRWAMFVTGGYIGHIAPGTTAADSSIIIKSGIFRDVMGGDRIPNGLVSGLGNYSTHIQVDGGNITDLWGSGYGNSSNNIAHNNVFVTVNGGTVMNLYGADKDATVYGDVNVQIASSVTVRNFRIVENGANVLGKKNLVLKGYGTSSAYATPVLAPILNADSLVLDGSYVELNAANEIFLNSLMRLVLKDGSRLNLSFTPSAASPITLYVNNANSEYDTVNPLITAPFGTGDIFNLLIPMDHSLNYLGGNDTTGATWTLSNSGSLRIGQEGTAGSALDVGLGLPESYDQSEFSGTPYQRYLQHMEELETVGADKSANVLAPHPITGEIELYVSPNGNDLNSGKKDEPFKTINRALEYVGIMKEALNPKGIVVYLREGTYFAASPITLGRNISGTDEAPVIISAYNGEEVILTGGKDITGEAFTAVTDEAVAERLNKNEKDNIVVADLNALGISISGQINAGATGGPTYQVFMNGNEMTLARYPNASRLNLGKVLDVGPVTATSSIFPQGYNSSSTGIEFVMQDLRPLRWHNDGNIWLYGCLYMEWDSQNMRIMEFREETPSVKLVGGNWYGAVERPHNTYYYYNVLEELDTPGEYYLDIAAGLLYIYPIGDMEGAKVTLSASASDILAINASDVVVNGLTLEYGAKNGITMSGCYQTVVQNCVIRNIATTGVTIDGKRSGVIHSTIEGIGTFPVYFMGKSGFFDYTPDNNFLQNCYISDTGTINPKYSYVYIGAEGVGHVISHNLIQGTFAVGIYNVGASECIVEYNEITGGPTGTKDCGAIYCIGFPTSRGNHYRYNYIHDIYVTAEGGESQNPYGLYFDSKTSENYGYGNIFENVPGVLLVNCGNENVFVNNVAIDGRNGSVLSLRVYNEYNANNMTLPKLLSTLPKINTSLAAYKSLSSEKKTVLRKRYPDLCKYYDDCITVLADRESQGAAYVMSEKEKFLLNPGDNYIVDNIIVNHGAVEALGVGDTITPNYRTNADPFTDRAQGDYSLKSGVDPGFKYETIPYEDIGIMGEKQGIGAFEIYAPADGSVKANPKGILLKWTRAAGADYYRMTIAKDAGFTEDVKEIICESLYYYAENDPYFDFGETYHWKVSAYTNAKSRVGQAVSGGAAFSFDTMTEEEYIKDNRANTTKLEEAIADAAAFLNSIVEGSDEGQYEAGTRDALSAAIADAQAVLGAAATLRQEQVDQATAMLKRAVAIAGASTRITYMTFGDTLSASDWAETTDIIPPRNPVTIDGDTYVMNVTGDRTEVLYKDKPGARQLMKFNYYLGTHATWHGIALRQASPNKFVTNAAFDSYFICFDIAGGYNQIELQKRRGGQTNPFVEVYLNADQLLTPGQWHEIEAGAISLTDGSVQVIFKIDGVTVFDYIDSENPIAEAGYFGVVLQPANGIVQLQPMILPSGAADIISVMTTPAGIQIDGTYLTGSVSYETEVLAIDATVSEKASWKLYSDAACTVEIQNGIINLDVGGNTAYIKVVAENGTAKVYTITITRDPADDNGENGNPSGAADIISVMTTPAGIQIDGTKLTGSVSNETETLAIDVAVSEKASWKLYSDAACTVEIQNGIIHLDVGENTAYIKVVAENGIAKVYTITVTRDPADDNGGNGNESESTPEIPSTGPVATDVDGETITPPVSVSNGTTNAKVSGVSVKKALENAISKANTTGRNPEIVITVPVQGNTAEVAITVPQSAFAEIGKSSDTWITAKAGDISLTLSHPAIDEINRSAKGDVIITAGKADIGKFTDEQKKAIRNRQVYSFWVVSGDVTHTAFKGNVKVSVPYSLKPGEDPNIIVVYYMDGEGAMKIAESSVYDSESGRVIFTTSRPATFMVDSNAVKFEDVNEHWGQSAIEFAAARGLVAGTGNGQYQPNREVTRAEFVQLVQNVLKLENTADVASYSDIEVGKWYYNAILSLAREGLLEGISAANNSFMPNKAITREEMAVILANVAKYNKLNTSADEIDLSERYRDFKSMEKGYQDKIEDVVKLGLMSGTGTDTFTPKGTATRAQAAQVQMNLLKLLYK